MTIYATINHFIEAQGIINRDINQLRCMLRKLEAEQLSSARQELLASAEQKLSALGAHLRTVSKMRISSRQGELQSEQKINALEMQESEKECDAKNYHTDSHAAVQCQIEDLTMMLCYLDAINGNLFVPRDVLLQILGYSGIDIKRIKYHGESIENYFDGLSENILAVPDEEQKREALLTCYGIILLVGIAALYAMVGFAIAGSLTTPATAILGTMIGLCYSIGFSGINDSYTFNLYAVKSHLHNNFEVYRKAILSEGIDEQAKRSQTNDAMHITPDRWKLKQRFFKDKGADGKVLADAIGSFLAPKFC